MDRSWRTWSDVAQRAIIAYVLVDIAFYVGAALPGGTTFGSAAAGGCGCSSTCV